MERRNGGEKRRGEKERRKGEEKRKEKRRGRRNKEGSEMEWRGNCERKGEEHTFCKFEVKCLYYCGNNLLSKT